MEIKNAHLSDNAINQIVEVVKPILEGKDKEIERLNNIINELEKWLEEQIKISQAHDNQLGVNVGNTFKNKLNELKGDSSNE